VLSMGRGSTSFSLPVDGVVSDCSRRLVCAERGKPTTGPLHRPQLRVIDVIPADRGGFVWLALVTLHADQFCQRCWPCSRSGLLAEG